LATAKAISNATTPRLLVTENRIGEADGMRLAKAQVLLAVATSEAVAVRLWAWTRSPGTRCVMFRIGRVDAPILESTMLRTAICDLLGIEHPIFCAPMGLVTGAELAAAVSGAGGFGILQAGVRSPAALRAEIQRIRSLTDKPFGVNFIQHFPHDAGVDVCLEERVAAVSFFWGDPRPFVERAHTAGVRVIDQVGSVENARRDVRAWIS
jgi:hypothetical protein